MVYAETCTQAKDEVKQGRVGEKGNKEHLAGLGRQPGAVKGAGRRKGKKPECRMQDAGCRQEK